MSKKTNLKDLKEADIKSASLFQLTDYDNLKDLSQFVKEYERAKALIAKCNEFYQSFLYSKLIPLSSLISKYQIKEMYEIKSSSNAPLRIMAVQIRKEAAERIKQKYEKTTPYVIHVSNNINSIAFKTYPEIPFSYWNFNFCKWEKEDGIRSYSYGRNEKHKEYEKRLLRSSNGQFLSVKDMYEKMTAFWDAICKDFTEEVKNITIEKTKTNEYNDLTAEIKIKNKLVETTLDMMSGVSYKKDGTKKMPKKDYDEYVKFCEELCETDTIEVNLVHFFGREKFNDLIIKEFSNETNGSFGGYGQYINFSKNDVKLNEYISKHLEKTNSLCSTIIHKYAKYAEDSEKMYVIDYKGVPHYFCDKNKLPSVKIDLETKYNADNFFGCFSWEDEHSGKVKELDKFKGHNYLTCTYKEEHKHQKHVWPSDSPWVVYETKRTIIFDVDSNEAINFFEHHDEHEESRRRY